MAQNDPIISKILSANAEWASHISSSKPDLFPSLATSQHPSILWIGCSDSRVPETTLTGCMPGDIFVHRNIANIIHSGDISAASVIEYAVAYLGVQRIVICGHEGCGGVGGALGNKKIGVVDTWLLPLRNIRMRLHTQGGKDWEALDPKEKVSKVVEENVCEGVKTVRANPHVIQAAEERGLKVVGLVYDVATGKLREVDHEEDEAVHNARKECFHTK